MYDRPDLEEVGTNLHRVAIHLLRHVRMEDSNLGIGPAQLSALSVLVFGGPKSLNDLAKADQVKPPTMSRVVEALVRAALVKRDVNSDDRRLVTISATKEGVAIMHEGRRRRVQRLVSLLRTLSSKDLERLKTASEILSRLLQNETS